MESAMDMVTYTSVHEAVHTYTVHTYTVHILSLLFSLSVYSNHAADDQFQAPILQILLLSVR